jgi:hypothetical protein
VIEEFSEDDLSDNPPNADNEITDEINNENDSTDHDESSEDTDVEPLQPRVRRVPGHLRDFVVGREAQEDQEQEELQNFAVYSDGDDPTTYDEAVKSEVWRKAMDYEIKSIEDNNTWELTTLPEGLKAIGVKWIYKTKFNEMGEIDKHKARLVAKGYSQKHGIYFNEVFAPVARWDTIRAVLALAASKGWCVYQLDVKSAFLHGDLSKDIYVEQPLGYQSNGGNKVYKLKKALYGLNKLPESLLQLLHFISTITLIT